MDSDEIFTEIKKNDIDRPLTPINESVLAAPETYNQLTRFIQQRIKPRSFWSHISTSDQHNVVSKCYLLCFLNFLQNFN